MFAEIGPNCDPIALRCRLFPAHAVFGSFVLIESDRLIVAAIGSDFFPALAGKEFYGFTTQEDFVDIGTPERYRVARVSLRRR